MLNCFKKTTCHHDRITIDKNAGYCPDCGEYVENKWYISRCACCGIKQKSVVMRGKVSADTKFCRNCGSSLFEVEELEDINIVNVNYAVVVRQTIERQKQSIIQTWIEENAFATMKLLPSY